MNHLCNGTYWPAIALYRCLLDGSFHELTSIPDKCPHCKRQAIVKVEEQATIKIVVVEEIKFDNKWLEISRKDGRTRTFGA